MTYQETMRKLKAMGTAQNIKVYKRHGAGDNLFGVSFANLNKLKKVIKTDQALAEKLWASGNSDARTLATMVADPGKISGKLLDQWARSHQYYLLSDMLAGLASRTPLAKKRMEPWTASSDEWAGRAGWHVLAKLAMEEGSLTDSYLENYLKRIERHIHRSKNFTRHAMNDALIAIGGRNPALKKKALAAARRIGKVEVDHGETGCKTLDAAAYIEKIWDRKKAARKKSR